MPDPRTALSTRRYVPRRWRHLPVETAPTVLWELLTGRARTLAVADAWNAGLSGNAENIVLFAAAADRGIVALENWRDIDDAPCSPVVTRGRAAEALDDEDLVIEIGAHVWSRGKSAAEEAPRG